MDNKPNVMIICTDQQRYDTIHELGYDYMITPNLDELCREGCSYVNAHTHNPICMPARHDLLLGMPARAHGYFANNEMQSIKDYSLPTLSRIFSDAGYRTAAIGKMHFSPSRAHHGYNELYLMEELHKHRYDDQYATYLKEVGLEEVQNLHGVRPYLYHTPQQSQIPLPHYETSWVKDKTIEWLDNNERDPFFLFVGYIKPHPPWDIPKEYQGIYKDKDIKKAINSTRLFPNNKASGSWFGDDDSEEQKRKIREAYFTTITMTDNSIGEIITYLRKSGQLDNTMIIFTSDHGEMLQDKGYYSKQMPYDSSVRVPFVIRYPELFKANTRNEDFVDLMDILPTCLDVCGLEYPGDIDNLYGESLCNGTIKSKNREEIICACEFLNDTRWVMSRNKRYKYIYRYNDGFEEFYDMELDPCEAHNIISDFKSSKVYKNLRKKACDYEATWGPEGAIGEEGDFIKFPKRYNDGWEYGKYHLWSNSQTHRFYRYGKDKCGKQLNKEIYHSIANEELSGTKLNEVFNDPYWKEDFETKVTRYGVKCCDVYNMFK
jgi:arylsulfatase A-like enzyme